MQLHRKRYELLQQYHLNQLFHQDLLLQYRKRYELLQQFKDGSLAIIDYYKELQYRKRYELLQQLREISTTYFPSGYNTASGMSCCNGDKEKYTEEELKAVTIPQAVWAVATKK